MSYVLLAPDPTFTGVCSGVAFENGVGVCGSDFLAGWLCAKGFTIPPDSVKQEDKPPDIPDDLDALGTGALVALAKAHGISLEGVRTGDKVGLIDRIKGGNTPSALLRNAAPSGREPINALK